jgi:hypothetical protein
MPRQLSTRTRTHTQQKSTLAECPVTIQRRCTEFTEQSQTLAGCPRTPSRRPGPIKKSGHGIFRKVRNVQTGQGCGGGHNFFSITAASPDRVARPTGPTHACLCPGLHRTGTVARKQIHVTSPAINGGPELACCIRAFPPVVGLATSVSLVARRSRGSNSPSPSRGRTRSDMPPRKKINPPVRVGGRPTSVYIRPC